MATNTLFSTSAVSRFPVGLLRTSDLGTSVANLVDANFPTLLMRVNALGTSVANLLDANFPTFLMRTSDLGTSVANLVDANFPSFLARDNELEDAATVGDTTRWTKSKLPTNTLYQDSLLSLFPSGLARVSALSAYALATAVRTDAQIETVVGGMVDGGTETGISVTFNQTTRKLNFIVSGGTTPPPAISTHQRYGAYGADATFVATDFTGAGGVGVTTNTLTISGATGSQYVAFWSAEALTRIDATGRAAFGSTNQFNRFDASRLTISSTNGYLYVSDAAFPAGYINGLWTLE